MLFLLIGLLVHVLALLVSGIGELPQKGVMLLPLQESVATKKVKPSAFLLVGTRHVIFLIKTPC